MAKLLPIILVLIGLAAGTGAGIALRPPPVVEDIAPAGCPEGEHCAETPPQEGEHPAAAAEGVDPTNVQYVKLDKQFVIPVVHEGRVSALVVMSLSIEITPEASQTVFEKEPKLRDSLLRVMFLHANSGGFEGQFTSSEAMKDLRGSLREAAREVLGPEATDVLVTDILRQDI